MGRPKNTESAVPIVPINKQLHQRSTLLNSIADDSEAGQTHRSAVKQTVFSQHSRKEDGPPRQPGEEEDSQTVLKGHNFIDARQSTISQQEDSLYDPSVSQQAIVI